LVEKLMGVVPEELVEMACRVLDACKVNDLMLAAAESCTGGLVTAALTSVAGSSAWVDRGFVTYSNPAKVDLLAVPADMIERYGAVSGEVARAMAEGALRYSAAQISVGITGVAGPGGGSPERPVGTVHIAAARRGQETLHEKYFFPGDRDDIRAASALAAMEMLIRRCQPDSEQ
jgi:nicotinamide-nucleotide amidase